jgi:hypothetical protein
VYRRFPAGKRATGFACLDDNWAGRTRGTSLAQDRNVARLPRAPEQLIAAPRRAIAECVQK